MCSLYLLNVTDNIAIFFLMIQADNFPDNIDSEVGKLRQELLKRFNELHQIEEREFEHNYKIEA